SPKSRLAQISGLPSRGGPIASNEARSEDRGLVLEHDLYAVVARAVFVGGVRDERLGIAVALGAHAPRVHAEADERVGDGLRAVLAQRLVGDGRARVVGVALDLDAADLGMVAEVVGELLDQRARLGGDLRRPRLEPDRSEQTQLLALELHVRLGGPRIERNAALQL